MRQEVNAPYRRTGNGCVKQFTGNMACRQPDLGMFRSVLINKIAYAGCFLFAAYIHESESWQRESTLPRARRILIYQHYQGFLGAIALAISEEIMRMKKMPSGEVCPFLERRLKMEKGKSPIERQMEKIFKHTRSGSFGTRSRYKSSCKGFVRFLHNEFKVKNLRNLHDKHIVRYIQHRQVVNQVSAKTLKNDIAAIRYMHDQVPRVKHDLSDNKAIQERYGVYLDKTPVVNGNRGWTQEEYNNMQALAETKGEDIVKDTTTLARTMGLRIAEATAVSRSQAEQALRTGIYRVLTEAKNGKHREVQLSQEAREVFQRRLQGTNRGYRLFVKSNEKVHEVINRIEKFVQNHRSAFETKEGIEQRTYERDGIICTNNATFHGLRYNYIQDRVQEEIDKGYNKEQAAQIVTKEVGHERADVIKIYLGGK